VNQELSHHPDTELDASGLNCPLPLLKAKQSLNALKSGQLLKVICTDPGSVRDFEVFAFGSSNPWGVDFDDHGQAFITACVIPHLFHIVQGSRYHRQSGEHFNRFTFPIGSQTWCKKAETHQQGSGERRTIQIGTVAK